MTVQQVLNMLSDRTWLVVRPSPGDDVCVWSDDWRSGAGYPPELKELLDWKASELQVQLAEDPKFGDEAPMIVIEARMNDDVLPGPRGSVSWDTVPSERAVVKNKN